MFRLIILSLLVVVTTILNRAGQEKDALRNPSLVKFNMKMERPNLSTSSFSRPGPEMQIQNSTLNFSEMEFMGVLYNDKLHKQKEFHYSVNLQNRCILKSRHEQESFLEFDVPAGEYLSARVLLHFSNQDSLPAMTLQGLWHPKANNKPIPVEMVCYDLPNLLPVDLERDKNTQTILFPKKGLSTLQIVFRPHSILGENWQPKTNEMQPHKSHQGYRLILSKNQNPKLHSHLIENLHQSMKARVH